MAEFQVKTPVFEGPLMLLLDLIEKRKLLINNISLAEVADDYITYIKQLDSFPIADTANFILVASTLLLIKSRSLLPALELTEEEKESTENLERRLALYKEARYAAAILTKQYGACTLFGALRSPEHTIFFVPASDLHILNIKNAVETIIQGLPVPEKISRAVVQKIMSLEEMITRLAERIQEGVRTTFREFTRTQNHTDVRQVKLHIAVSFLAMLELVKNGIVYVEQCAMFDDIAITKQEA